MKAGLLLEMSSASHGWLPLSGNVRLVVDVHGRLLHVIRHVIGFLNTLLDALDEHAVGLHERIRGAVELLWQVVPRQDIPLITLHTCLSRDQEYRDNQAREHLRSRHDDDKIRSSVEKEK